MSRAILFLGALLASFAATPCFAEPLALQVRSQVETSKGSGRYHTLTNDVSWDPAKTAIVVCDMWNQHWCRGATGRVAEMATRMNAVLHAARDRGVLIIHCPSDTMEFYKDAPQRQTALNAKHVETKEKLESWRALNPELEPALPIDDSDGGCDCDPPCPHGGPWRRQIETLEILPQDAITDSAEAFYLMEERGIENVIVMGVHTNMCVLGRPFSIRQMVTLGKNRHDVLLSQRPVRESLHRHRSRGFSHRAALVPYDSEHGSRRRHGVSLRRRSSPHAGDVDWRR
jgi:nicotinamidase-related amidase